MTMVNNVSFKSLTPADINRLPGNSVIEQSAATLNMPADEVSISQKEGAKKMPTWAKAAIGVAVAALALVGLKHLGQNSFMKFDANGKGFMNAVKKYAMTAADYIEKPFVWTYQQIAGLFARKGPEAAQ